MYDGLNESSQNTGSTGLLRPFQVDERPLSERMRPSAPRYPETLAKCRPSGDSRAASPRSDVAPPAQAEGAREAGLGILAKSVGRCEQKDQQNKAIEHRQALRRTTYHLQRQAARLLGRERVGKCKWTVQHLSKSVKIMRGEDRAFYKGLQTCGSVWSCPACSNTISDFRRQQLNELLQKSREMKYAIVMLTLTAQHKRGDDLGEQLAGLKAAKKAMRQRRDWKALKDVLIGSVTATEATYGKAGWHTHFHEIFILDCAQDDAEAVMRGFAGAWVTALEKQGLKGVLPHAFNVQGAHQAGEYMAKWGAAEEVALGAKKAAKDGGRTPFGLLRDYAKGDDQAGQLFRHFALTFKGTRQLVWSRGLKELFGIADLDDEAVANEDAEMQRDPRELADISTDQWPDVRSRRVKVLEAAERETGDALVDDQYLIETIYGHYGYRDDVPEQFAEHEAAQFEPDVILIDDDDG